MARVKRSKINSKGKSQTKAKTKAKAKAKRLGRGKRYATALDIGHFSVKILTLVGDDTGQMHVHKVTLNPLAATNGNVSEDKEELRERQFTALKDAIKKHGKLLGRITLCFPRKLSTIRYITLPSANREEIKEMLMFDVERHVPFTVDDLEVGFEIMGKAGEHETKLMMVCVPKKEIEPHVQMCMDAGIYPDSVDLDVNGDCAAYRNSCSADETAGILNFGRTGVNLSIMKNGHMLFSRSLPSSEERLLQGFAGAKKWKDLQGRVTDAGPLMPHEREHFYRWVEKLETELKRSVSAFVCEHEDEAIDRTFLCGGAGYFPAGPPQGLEKHLRVQPQFLQNVPPMNGELPPSKDYHGSELSPVIGLAIRGLKNSQNDLNLLPQSFIQEQIQKEKSTFRKNIAILTLMFLILLGGAGYAYWQREYTKRSVVEDFYSELIKETSQLEVMRKKINKVEEYLDTSHSATNIIKRVLEAMPPRCYISKITFNKRRSLEITGQVPTEQDVINIQEKLSALSPAPGQEGYFTSVKPSSSQQILDLGTKQMQVKEFTMTCAIRWKENTRGF